jgi:hypothetical protein
MTNGGEAQRAEHPIIPCYCPVCNHLMSGLQCTLAAGMSGYFYCPNCTVELEMRGRWISLIIMVLLTLFLIGFNYAMFVRFPHSRVGYTALTIAEVGILAFVGFLCGRGIVKLHRRDADTSFVL